MYTDHRISPGISLEGLMLKLKLQYFGHLMQRVDSLQKTLMLGGIGGRSRRGRQRMRWLMASPTRWLWVWVNSRSWWWTGRPGMLQFMGSQRVGHDWVTELNWTEENQESEYIGPSCKSQGLSRSCSWHSCSLCNPFYVTTRWSPGSKPLWSPRLKVQALWRCVLFKAHCLDLNQLLFRHQWSWKK